MKNIFYNTDLTFIVRIDIALTQSYESKKYGRFVRHKIRRKKLFCIFKNISWFRE